MGVYQLIYLVIFSFFYISSTVRLYRIKNCFFVTTNTVLLWLETLLNFTLRWLNLFEQKRTDLCMSVPVTTCPQGPTTMWNGRLYYEGSRYTTRGTHGSPYPHRYTVKFLIINVIISKKERNLLSVQQGIPEPSGSRFSRNLLNEGCFRCLALLSTVTRSVFLFFTTLKTVRPFLESTRLCGNEKLVKLSEDLRKDSTMTEGQNLSDCLCNFQSHFDLYCNDFTKRNT